jgi:histidine triad (HIT) family protein
VPGADAALLLAEHEHGVATLGRFAATRGHVMVVPRRHVERLSDIPSAIYREVQHLAWQAAVTLERTLGAKRVYVASLGSATPRPTSFQHLHIHVVPIYDDDERARPSYVFSWSRGVYVYEGGRGARAL